jgi:hypothetical protein
MRRLPLLILLVSCSHSPKQTPVPVPKPVLRHQGDTLNDVFGRPCIVWSIEGTDDDVYYCIKDTVSSLPPL